MSRVVVFGDGRYADEAYFYFRHDSPHEIAAFTVDRAYLKATEWHGLPIVAFEEVVKKFPPEKFKMFIAVGYQDLNRLRARKCEEAKVKGYELVSYLSSRACNAGDVALGQNCFVLDMTVLQPGCRIGNNVFIWSSNLIGHHSTIGDHCYIAGQVVVSGGTVIEPHCFIGVHATIGHEIRIGRESLIGAGALVTKDVGPNSVYIVADTPKYRLDADRFLQLTKMK